MLFQTGQTGAGPPFAETEYIDFAAQITLAAAATLALGATVCRDITQLVGIAGQSGASNTQNLPDVVVVPSSANAGRTYGVYQGPSITNLTGQSVAYFLAFRRKGVGLVLATAVTAGTAVTVGSNLISQPTTSNQVIVGAFATGKEIGMVIALQINTTNSTAITAGAARVVTPTGGTGMSGISTTTPLTIDSAGSGLQETVTPTAITATTFTATFANSHGAGVSITGSSTAPGASQIAVPGSGSTTGLVTVDLDVS
jgi:hypothetical protein